MISNHGTAVITGASRGIGKEIALKFAKEGFNIAIACRSNKDMLENVYKDIIEQGVDCITYTGDLSYSANVKKFFSDIHDRFNTVDVLINNAGVSYVGLLSEMSDNNWNTVINSNLSSVFYCCREVIPDMVRRNTGHIVNISSVWGCYGASCEVAYSASKGAVNAFTKALAKELAPSNVQINAVACGLIDTSMNSHLSTDELEDLYNEIPAGRAGSTSEVADTVYEISRLSSYLTGQIITIDGGWF